MLKFAIRAITLAIVLNVLTGCLLYKVYTIDYADFAEVSMRNFDDEDVIYVYADEPIDLERKIEEIKDACKELGRTDYKIGRSGMIKKQYFSSYSCIGGKRRSK